MRKHLTCGGGGQREVVGGKTLKIGFGSRLWRVWIKSRVIRMKETYLQIILPRDLL